MLKNYLKVAFRNLWKNRSFSLINITGLAIGMASAMLILLWIRDEVSFDQFHEKKDRIYELWNRAAFSGKLQCWNTTPKIAASAIQKDLPEVEHTVRVDWPQHILFTYGEKRLMVPGNNVDSDFLWVFSFPLLHGNPATALNDPHSLIITESLARSIFGSTDVIGKIIKIDNKDLCTITAVAKNPPGNSRFQFDYLLPWAFLRRNGYDDDNWENNSTRTYVLLHSQASPASAQAKIKHLKFKYSPNDPKWEEFLYPMSRWRLYSNFTNGLEDGGKIGFVRLFGAIAGFILLIACINFMNLSTARSERRAKEVGIRKVVGAKKSSLVAQFMGESILIALIGGIIALGIVALSLPGFNQLTQKKLALDLGNPYLLLSGTAFILFTGILAGSYPAFFLSGFRPVRVLKGLATPAHALVTPRKVLVVVQFSFAILLIICTIIVRQQISYAQNRASGYDRGNLVFHDLTGDINKNYNLIKQELIQSGTALSVTRTSAPITEGWSDSWGFEWAGKDPNDKTDFDRFCADEGLARTAGLQFVEGRDFDLEKFPTDSLGIILNESAVKAMNFKQPLGQIIKDDGHNWHVVGVIKDFILQSPFSPMRPMAIEGSKGWFFVMHFRLNDKRTVAENLKQAGAIFKKYNPQYPFEYHFVDEEYASKFEDEKRTETQAGLFAGLSIFISCLGLFGLATYMAENRTKEIGIRKVLGASVGGIAGLLSKDFLRLVLISFGIASPLAWWGMYTWLQNYPYRIQIGLWVFVLACGISLLIALGTVSYQAVRAALANPARSLRTE